MLQHWSYVTIYTEKKLHCMCNTTARYLLRCLSQVPLPSNGQIQAFGLPPVQGFPVMMPPVGHALPGQPLPGSTGPPGFMGGFVPHNAAQQQQVNLTLMQRISKTVDLLCHE